MANLSFGPDGISVSGIGGGAKSHSKRPYNFAREVASNQMQWRAEDARRAGLHPLAALGITPQGSPPHVVGSQPGITGQVSTKTLSGPEAASIRESNARTTLYKKQADHVQEQINASKAARIKQGIQDHDTKPLAQAEHSGAVVERGIAKFANTPDAQQWQDRYGELFEQLGGLVNLGADAVANVPESVFDSLVDWFIENQERQSKRKNFKQYEFMKPKTRKRRQ